MLNNKKTIILTSLLIFVISIFVVFAIEGNFALALTTKPTTLPNPLGEGATPQTLIGKIINAALGIVGSIALLMFIYGGFVWMTAAGNEQSVTKGRDILIWATVGLIIIFSSYALVKFVFTGLGV